METREALNVAYVATNDYTIHMIDIESATTTRVNHIASAGYFYVVPKDGSILRNGIVTDVKQGDIILTSNVQGGDVLFTIVKDDNIATMINDRIKQLAKTSTDDCCDSTKA